jgi:hypothetical protein
MPSSARFVSRFDIDSALESRASGCESATNTTPSAPFRTSLRVAS